MSFEHDIIINYSTSDNTESEGNDLGWIDNFNRFLDLMLFQVMGEKPKILLKSDKDTTDQNELQSACVMIAVMSRNFIESDTCLDSLKSFINITGDPGNTDHPRLFKVFKTPLRDEDQPAKIRDLISYDLYQLDEESGQDREVNDYFGPDAEKNYWMKLVDLTYDVYETLINHQDIAEKADIKPLYTQKTIYLAQTGHDLIVQRNIIRRELQRHGFKVCPNKALPKDPDALEKTIKKYLKDCNLSIHLIGNSYGDIPPGADRSIIDMQNKIAGEMSGEQDKDTANKYPRLIWISPNLKNVTDQQQAFIDNLRRDVSSLEGAEILETPLEDFKNVIREELIEGRERRRDPSLDDENDNKRKVYLIYDRIDTDDAMPLAKMIENNGYSVIHPAFDDELLLMRQHHIDRLLNFDIAIVFKGKVNDQWVRMKVLDLLKAPGFGRKKPVLGRAVVTAPGVKIDKDIFQNEEVEIIESPKTGIQQENVMEFLNNVKEVI